MVNTSQKSIIDTHTKTRKESRHNTKDSHQIIQEQKKKGAKTNHRNSPQTINKIAIRTYVSIGTFSVNRLNAPIKIHRVTEWIQKQGLYICCL